MTSFSSLQFAVFRLIFGLYLACHFVELIPYGGELFSNRGVLADPRLNFTYGLLPNVLEHFDSPGFITVFLGALTALSLAFAAGFYRHAAALLLWYGWACLFNRNNLINNPSIPYIGLLLLLSLLIPAGEKLSIKRTDRSWHCPAMVQWSAWILLAAGYSFSGWMKLQSPSWIDGTALYHVLNNPLARPGVARDLLLFLPASCLQVMTWVSLGAELFCLPLSFSQPTRKLAWSALVLMNLSVLFVINFADLTIGMLMIHLFTYDRAWFRIDLRGLREKKSLRLITEMLATADIRRSVRRRRTGLR